jgi:uncharacterized protein YcbX
MRKLTLTEIWIYPVKSLGGIRLEKAKGLGKGLQHDRRWMLVDGAGQFLTQRDYPEMALFKLAIQDGELSITFRRNEKILATTSFMITPSNSKTWMFARIWDDDVSVSEVSGEISQWFSQHLGITCKLVRFPEESPRPVNPSFAVNKEHVSLADGYPFLIIGQSSLDDLNRRLSLPLPMNRFRPNFVFTGGEPYEEDEWKTFSIGGNKFCAVKKSARCTIPTVNQDTAEKSAEPLRTLSEYRNVSHNVYFGQNLVAIDETEVAVGDPIILYK